MIPEAVLKIIRPAYHYKTALLAAVVFWFPSRGLKVIGVTGTKGKTTTVELLYNIFMEAGFKTASASSLFFRIGEGKQVNDKKMTMPGRFFLQKFLRRAARSGCRYAILEVTSEGIKQFRHKFINFHSGIFINLSPEHLETHGGYENYLKAKLKLFRILPHDGFAIINKEDKEAKKFASITKAQKVFYGKQGVSLGEKNFSACDFSVKNKELSFVLEGEKIKSSLGGEFNLNNILAASAAALSEGISLEKIAEGVSRLKKIEGRYEFVIENPLRVVVDYAHTPDSLREVYKSLKLGLPETAGLICVLGSAGGGRDKWKRPELGKIASEFCREIIITNEDPYDEDPRKIMSEVLSGVSDKTRAREILDRREAIKKALQDAKVGDTVVVTGKGAEPWMAVADGKKISWDDRTIVKEENDKLQRTDDLMIKTQDHNEHF